MTQSTDDVQKFLDDATAKQNAVSASMLFRPFGITYLTVTEVNKSGRVIRTMQVMVPRRRLHSQILFGGEPDENSGSRKSNAELQRQFLNRYPW